MIIESKNTTKIFSQMNKSNNGNQAATLYSNGSQDPDQAEGPGIILYSNGPAETFLHTM